MKQRLGLFAGLVASIIALTNPALADDRKGIEGLYDKLAKAILANKPEGTLALETADFKAKGMDGQIRDGKQLVEQMKQESANSKLKKFKIKLVKVDVKGKSASVDTSFTGVSEMTDKMGSMGPKGKTHVMAMTGTAHNDLEKTKSGWKFKSMEEKPGNMTLDGKPFDPGRMMAPPQHSQRPKGR